VNSDNAFFSNYVMQKFRHLLEHLGPYLLKTGFIVV